ncbi:MAG: leucine-rich repeat domain-containing protein [Capnocytophaga sp.]|nr:leucine-rich repeat domain-containing protein [Capnocytophaga sp.]
MERLIKRIAISALSLLWITTIPVSCTKETVELTKIKKASTILMGEGVPSLDKGEKGDYYIDRQTGLLYGPKTDEKGWGQNPFRLVSKESLSNSTIVTGDGVPSLDKGKVGDLYLDKKGQKLYGPKTEQGWGRGYELGDKSPRQQKDEWPDYRLSKDGKTLLAWVNQRTVHLDMRTDSKLNAVTTIAKEAFTPAYALSSVIISDNVTDIEVEAFSSLPFLEIVTLPGSIKKINRGIFNQCPKLRIINLSEGLQTIEDFSLSDASFEEINIPKSVKKIGGYAFANNEKLLKINLQEGLKEIGSMAFSGCTELTRFEIPASVDKIGESAFASCTKVNTLVLYSKDIPKWSNYLIADFEELESIYVPDESVEIYKNDAEWGENDADKIKPMSQMPKE